MLVYLLICSFACFKVHYYVGKLQVVKLSFYYIYVCVTMISILPNNRRLWQQGEVQVEVLKGHLLESVYPLYRLTMGLSDPSHSTCRDKWQMGVMGEWHSRIGVCIL